MLDGQPLEGCVVSQNASTHYDCDTPRTTQLSHQGELTESKRIVAQQQVQPQQSQPTAEASNTDPAVVGRMLELEGAIALVRSSLDNHASSYYSVASQIAELNARISHLGIRDRSIKIEDDTSNSIRLNCKPSSSNGAVVDASATIKPIIPARACGTDVKLDDTGNGREDFGGDEQYTRIQDMVDLLIKDANLALNCKPDDFPCGIENTANIRTGDAEYDSGPQMSQLSEPDETATLVMDSSSGRRMDADIALLKGNRRCLDDDYVHMREEARARSNTYTTEASPTTAVPADAYTYESLHSSWANSDCREHVLREVPRKPNSIGLQSSLSSMSPLHDCAVGRATYRSASSHYMTAMHHGNPHATKNIVGFLSSPPVKRGTVNTSKDVLFPELGDSKCRRADRLVSDSRGGTGLLSMFSLLYWTLLFTLGALMLDSFLCQVAGKHVMGTVDKIAHAETNDLSSPEDTSSSESFEKQDKAEYGSEHGKASGSTNLANTVGRFVRWYVEEPQHISASNRDRSQTRKEHPRLLRMRKASAMRGSFKHIG
ncbi:hypothetical protein H4S08_001452 [Coemansia sp. RSA 1365]|nr:hypothetical protein H4S08_001452 [Coemansia sp. RSA 1365]